MAAFRQAHDHRDWEALSTLVCWDRVTPETKKLTEDLFQGSMDIPIVSIKITTEHPKGRPVTLTYVRNGITYGFNRPVIAELVVENPPLPREEFSGSYYPLAVKDGRYCIAQMAPIADSAMQQPVIPPKPAGQAPQPSNNSKTATLTSQVTQSIAPAETTLPAKETVQSARPQSSPPPKDPTLTQVLGAGGLKPPTETVQDLDHAITSYATLKDRDVYLIAYYWDSPSGRLEDPLRVLSFNPQTAEWRSVQLTLGSEQIGHSECVGSVLHAYVLPTAFLLDTHINPSAGCLLILERNLAFRNALYGWYLGAVGDTQIVFQRSEVHFAAVHPTELALYDLKTNREISLFPLKPFQHIRTELTAKLEYFYRTHLEWCQQNNDPCDASSMDSSLHGEVVVSAPQHALAFVISYEHIQDSAGPVQKPDGPEVVYVYRHLDDETKLDYREMLLSDVEKRFGKLSPANLLEPDVLREIFASSSAN